MKRECESCGVLFQAPKSAKTRFCTSKCAVEGQAVRKAPPLQHITELDRFMAQPEVAQLRAGIQTAIRAAWTRCFGG